MKFNIASNYAQRFLQILLRFFMIPIYIDAFGISAYGLIGFYITLSSTFVLLDFGMGYASIRLLADRNETSADDVAAVLRIVERAYLFISLVIGGGIFLCSSFIAKTWLTVDDTSFDAVTSIQLMSVLVLVSWPHSLYQSFLMGQQRFVTMNTILIVVNIVFASLMFLGIKYLGYGVNFYFFAMVLLMLLQGVFLRQVAWVRLSKNKLPAKREHLKHFYSYAGGVSIFSILSLLFFQGPLLILSSNAGTSELGLYNLAMTFPMALITLMYPIGSVFFPKFLNIATNLEAQKYFSTASLLMGGFILGSCLLLNFNMSWIYELWLGKENTVPGMILISQELLYAVLFYGYAMVFNNLLLANGNNKALGLSYTLAIVWLGYSVLLFPDDLGALNMASFWKETALVLMFFVIVFGLFTYKHLFANWIKNLMEILALSLIAYGGIVWILDVKMSESLVDFSTSIAITLFIFSPLLRRIYGRLI
jgi:O-antigen/teichoic acid export membrane protein